MARERHNHFRQRFRALLANRGSFWTHHPRIMVLTLATAVVWLLFGIWFKVLGLVPRHRLIVAAVVGESGAGPLTVLIGVAETAMALWIVMIGALSLFAPQTVLQPTPLSRLVLGGFAGFWGLRLIFQWVHLRLAPVARRFV